MKHDPFDAMQEGIHMDFDKYTSSLKWTWTGSAFSTNESAWSVLVTGPQSCVWGGP